MATSQNGGLVLQYGDSRLITTVIPGTKAAKFVGGIAGEDLNILFMYFGYRWHTEIEPIIAYGCWGHNVRAIRGQESGYSNHASGTAVDVNAPQHPLGTLTLTAKQRDTLRTIENALEGVIRMGAFYTGRKDEMHGEKNKVDAQVTRLANKIRNGELPNVPDELLSRIPGKVLTPAPTPISVVPAAPHDNGGWPLAQGHFFGPSQGGSSHNGSGSRNELNHVAEFQNQLRVLGYDIGASGPDGRFGPKTAEATRAWQARNLGGEMKVIVSGLCGWNDYQAIHSYAKNPAQTATPKPAFPGLMKYGSNGPAVTMLQNRLNEHLVGQHLPKIGVDGKFGPTTEKWVIWFQGTQHLVADGDVGSATWSHLF